MNDIWQQLFILPADQIPWWAEVVRSVLRLVIALAGGLGSVPILVWLERRLLGWFQGRLGPNRVGPFGLFQPLADALKLMMKEDIIPTNVDRTIYVMAPAIALFPVIMSLTVLPWNGSREWGAVAPNIDVGILFLLAVGSIEVYGAILAGWSSNNKYSLLGGLRASSQVISYELGMGLSIIAVLLMAGTLGTQNLVMGYDLAHTGVLPAGTMLSNGQALINVVSVGDTGYTVYEHAASSGFWDWHFLRLFPFGLVAAGIYMISMIAETNRAPFDLPEAETELVAGFHTEYSSFKFAMFFMGEYANMLIVSAICVTLFFGGWLAPWGLLSQLPPATGLYVAPWLVNFVNSFVIAPLWLFTKLYLLIGFFIAVRASFPRLRYDMLMKFGWKGMLPVALGNIVMIATSLAIQQVSEPTMGKTGSWWAGQIVAWAMTAVVAGILFYGKYVQYQAKKAAKTASTELTAPIRRPTVVVPTPSAPAPEA
jgi:NADH-quinone oxidoreductase subunit H